MIPAMHLRRTIAASCLPLWATQSVAGGGPNPIEGAGLFGLWLLPLLGYVLVFGSMAISGFVRTALKTTLALAVGLAAMAFAGDIGLLAVLLFGPWMALVGISIVAAVRWYAALRWGTPERPLAE